MPARHGRARVAPRRGEDTARIHLSGHALRLLDSSHLGQSSRDGSARPAQGELRHSGELDDRGKGRAPRVEKIWRARGRQRQLLLGLGLSRRSLCLECLRSSFHDYDRQFRGDPNDRAERGSALARRAHGRCRTGSIYSVSDERGAERNRGSRRWEMRRFNGSSIQGPPQLFLPIRATPAPRPVSASRGRTL